ncbi:hypothetical protein CN327_30515 [Bacillus cereus]|uniref:Uncharacterized protein n=1 Tax=Bacillus nitratireducens TaxID=2026193 RepID=A0ABU6PIQ9_9BACI|nr:hypothetical protein [Bacillus nitratireducens]OSX91276.1 hypothetical protein BTJ45_03265 [Bacillus mycoides]PDY21257.1 hypothetical protein COM83_24085 [Bacillus cereus]MDR4173394.1 hypothetical protein [Bacillus nitratireducens]MED0906588.1 hypothetical protein [Bacillus nitratireducens]MED4680412.1 hypothetical protein [Bacillus nitratireducens]
MNEVLSEKYKIIKFPDEVVNMFADILEEDEILYNVFHYIGSEVNKQYQETKYMRGISINEIVGNVVIDRRVKKLKGKSYSLEVERTNISRRSAEVSVSTLSSMSLITEKIMHPYKFLISTIRGQQVLIELGRRKQTNR